MPKPPKSLPTLTAERPSRRRAAAAPAMDGLVFAVYAPFGSDPILSRYPSTSQAPIAKQALVLALQKTAAEGVNISALIDLYEDDSYLVEIPAGQPASISITSVWKQDMSAPQALSGFLRRSHARFPCASLVLAIEGHGGGFVPDIDRNRITPKSITQWTEGTTPHQARWIQTLGQTQVENDPNAPGLPISSPELPISSPELPISSPELPATRLPLSTWALGAALASAVKSGVPRPAVIHFSNCFNASLEVLHTVAPYADYATGYANYDFFTAGASYPAVFHRLRQAGTASALQLAQWFAAENGAVLKAKQNHPIVGATVPLRTVRTRIAAALDALATGLTQALRAAPDRQSVVMRIRNAAIAAQHFDTDADNRLQVPDQFVDLGSFAASLQTAFSAAGPGANASLVSLAAALQATLAGFHVFGDWDRPWTDESQIWDFRNPVLAISIFCPDPDLRGVWDWRSPYYLAGKVDPTLPPAQRHVIDFLADQGAQRPRWVEFIVEYHKGVQLAGFLPALNPVFPLFNGRFKPTLPHPGDEKPRG